MSHYFAKSNVNIKVSLKHGISKSAYDFHLLIMKKKFNVIEKH